MSSDTYEEIDMIVVRTSEKAALCDTGDDESHWIPFSVMEGASVAASRDAEGENKMITIQVADWYLTKEGIV